MKIEGEGYIEKVDVCRYVLSVIQHHVGLRFRDGGEG